MLMRQLRFFRFLHTVFVPSSLVLFFFVLSSSSVIEKFWKSFIMPMLLQTLFGAIAEGFSLRLQIQVISDLVPL